MSNLYNDLVNTTWGRKKLTTTKKEQESRKQEIRDLHSTICSMEERLSELELKLSRQTAVYTPYDPFDSLFCPRKPTPKTVYAPEAIKLVAKHLGMRFDYHASRNTLEPIPPPKEDNDET
ncbi:hypothetical protein LCGC14_0344450 [marine sediment metagenome]|uniref:Uncharacterized protein n=1 Tax=marine sediment metagenome TaxID=412755 RepID=A0A0F9TIA6_9ZZZZ